MAMASLHRPMSLPLLLLFLLISGHLGLDAEARNLQNPTKLFVFGDSYADTGNVRRDVAGSWKQPYGITFPGKPAGRFSDGRVLTDFLAKYFGVRSPAPYRLRNLMPQYVKYGMNFAYGGTGVFNTSSPNPNMTVQIDFFEELIRDKVYTFADLCNSVALVSVAGNDYSFYLATNGTAEGAPAFIASVVNQTVKNVARIHGLGVKKIAVSGLQPLGCLPQTTASSSFQQCNSTFNTFATLHNTLLGQGLAKLKEEANDNSSFVVLDLFDSFMSVLNHPSTHNIQNQFKPCCVGVSSQYSCGSVDDKTMAKKYTVCEDPKSAFFWDWVHPTQAGWHAVYNNLLTTNALQQLQ
ncbi:LOW QUALITY PROTEIN: GDSL esterase/lipase At5g03610-like [Prosopis cineraria]|uniref:LOW QUALITY PROTEIN: GDSL esterase/lipase At5g03610-like n=1 Tax=Prosopis cineraria TaxID=364024 RepID=UPI00240FBED9|nr:LOW QUALITY PROTEIN: GDSL esterase/lipase At5g03610-like [Prosopis cineraria]